MRTAIGLCYQVLPVKDKKNQGEIAQFTATQRKGGKKTPHIYNTIQTNYVQVPTKSED